LWIGRERIEKNKGRIWFESQEDQGTTFFFTLPVYREKVIA
jgi:signal transduction histidine kinase